MDCIGLSRFGTGRHGRWLVGLLLFFLAWTSAAAPPTPPRRTAPALPPRTTPARPQPAPDGQRFLFVVDISSAMRATEAANRQALFDMLFTGLDGQMRTGDTFGLWFYNDKLHAGTFPMQIWDEKDPLPVASLATKFLREQQYSGRSRPKALMPSLLKLINNVRDVNVLVISHGKPALEGTPFDTNIAAIVRRKHSEREQAQKPFITALAARGGTIVSGAVVIAGDTLLLPERPVAVLTARGTNAPAQPTNATRIATSGALVKSPAAVVTGETQTTASPAPRPAVPPKWKVLQLVTHTNAVATNLVAVPVPTRENSISSADLSWTGIDLGFRPPESGFATANPEPVTAIAKLEAGTRDPEPREQTKPDPVPARPALTTLANLAEALDSEPVPVAARSPGANGASAAPATVLAPTPGPSPLLLLMIGIVLLAACLGLLLLVLRRLRPRHQGSFITRSMELR